LTPTPFPVKTNRDVLLFEFPNGEMLVVGCDSAGGIGPKPLDKLKVDGYILGKFTARAALMEVLSVGADLVCVVDALGVEPEPLGAEILRGIRDEAVKAGLDPQLAVTGSTEKNIAVEQTGIGVTVVGTCRKEQLKIGTSQAGDVVVAVGVPCVGAEVIAPENQNKMAESTDILALRRLEFVHEIIPVGSTGIAHEVEKLAEGAGLKFKLAEQSQVNVEKSAGPATVLLISLPKLKQSELRMNIKKPLTIVAYLLSSFH
jgi:hypothetical protein